MVLSTNNPFQENISFEKTIDELTEVNLKSLIGIINKNRRTPFKLFIEMGSIGLMSLFIPKKYGGYDLDFNQYVNALIEISIIDPSLVIVIATHNSLCSQYIFQFGNDFLKEKYLPKLSIGRSVGSWAIMELNMNNEISAIQCQAVKIGEIWILNGKAFILSSDENANTFILFAQTGERKFKNSITAFVIEKGTHGVNSFQSLDQNISNDSSCFELVFKDYIITDEQRLGIVGDGYTQAKRIIEGARISIAALSLSITIGNYENILSNNFYTTHIRNKIYEMRKVSNMVAEYSKKISAFEKMLNVACEFNY